MAHPSFDTGSANVPVELAPDTWLIVPPKGTELPKGSGPGVIVLAHSARQAETIVKSATATKTVSTSKGATSPTKVLQSTTKTIVAKAANNTIWLGKRAETLKGTNRPPIAGEPFALLPDPIKRKRITNAAAANRLAPELTHEALRYWHLEDLGGSGSLSLRHYLDAIGHNLTTATHTLRHDTARTEHSIKNEVVRFAGYEHTLVREIEAHPERAASVLEALSGPANVLVILEGRAIERKSVAIGRSAVRYGKTLAREIEAHPERAAAVLAVAAVATAFVGPEGAAVTLELLSIGAGGAAGANAAAHGKYLEAGVDFASAGLGAAGVGARVLRGVLPVGRETQALTRILREVETTPVGTLPPSTAQTRALDQAAIAKLRRLILESDAYGKAGRQADSGSAALALIALDPSAALEILDQGAITDVR
jgi:hypothetical protein